eukprot:2246694-Rhodomonas_salina.1
MGFVRFYCRAIFPSSSGDLQHSTSWRATTYYLTLGLTTGFHSRSTPDGVPMYPGSDRSAVALLSFREKITLLITRSPLGVNPVSSWDW